MYGSVTQQSSSSKFSATVVAELFLFDLLAVMHDGAVVVGGSLVQSVDFVKVVLLS